ncbi:MAG: cytochrome c3 family protein [Steroidobacterales bacterium]
MRAAASATATRAAWLMALAWLGGSGAFAASVETLLMPGPVTRAHVKQEETCTSCHDRSNVRTQTSLCLDCHKAIAADVQQHHGYHGRMPNAGLGECRGCHTEHKGRGADIMHLDRTDFGHGFTDFPLEGAHAGLDCAGCHKQGVAWRKASATCAGCHKSDDVHKAQFKQLCGECHSSATWTGGKFDHDKTDFRLTGAHTTLTCNACHVAGRYTQTPKSCNGCHVTDDVHRGVRGTDCAKCHSTKEWKNTKYDHLKETGYELLGVHEKVPCAGCHRNGNLKEKIPKDCNGCHQADDTHAARFGAKCADCHGNEKWPMTDYDHAGKHKYPLDGAHAKIDCYACHTAVAARQKLPKDCAGCHRSEDAHAGKLQGACDACHGQKTWRSDIGFDHDLTKYPLLGLHRVASCAQCHATEAFSAAPTACVDCHMHEDVHKGGLGKKCQDCHSTNGWPLWMFDHAKKTHFPLLGAHAKLQCADCHHLPPGTVKTPSTCVSCHHKDDRHLGQFGARCNQCHGVDSWKGARIQ